MPDEMIVIEVRYLYSFKGGSLFQPTFNEPRNDVETKEYLIDQLKTEIQA